jgi:hypothetical protein
MSNEHSPRRIYEQYLKGNATFEDVERAAQRVMDRYAEAVQDNPAADATPRPR